MQTEAAVVDAEVAAQGIPDHRVGMDQGNFLRQNADIDGIAPQILEAVDPTRVTPPLAPLLPQHPTLSDRQRLRNGKRPALNANQALCPLRIVHPLA
jgi:hypothetical protein